MGVGSGANSPNRRDPNDPTGQGVGGAWPFGETHRGSARVCVRVCERNSLCLSFDVLLMARLDYGLVYLWRLPQG